MHFKFSSKAHYHINNILTILPMKSQSYSPSYSNTYMYQMQLFLYMNDHDTLPPNKIKNQIFIPQYFKYTGIQFYLMKWDYRIDMIFDNKNARQNAIEEIKKLKNTYGISYHYDLKKNPFANKYLMDQREYYHAIDYSQKFIQQILQKKKSVQKQLNNSPIQQEKAIKEGEASQNIVPQKNPSFDQQIQKEKQRQREKKEREMRQREMQAQRQRQRREREERIKSLLKNNELLRKLIVLQLKVSCGEIQLPTVNEQKMKI